MRSAIQTRRGAETTWAIPSRLTELQVEEWLEQLKGTTPSSLKINVGSWRDTALFGDARLLGALSRLRSEGTLLRLGIPPRSLTQDRLEHLNDPSARRTPSEDQLGWTIAGLGLSQLCELDDSHRWWATESIHRLLLQQGYWGIGQERSYVENVSDDDFLGERPAFEIRRSRTYQIVENLMQSIGVQMGDKTDLIKSFAFQAWENANEHGSTEIDDGARSTLRYLSMRRTSLQSLKDHLGDVAKSRFQWYVDHLLEFVSGTKGDRDFRLLELTISDGGVGIAARMARNEDIYADDYEREVGLFMRALQPNGSSKARGEPGWGRGFVKMLRAAYCLQGIVVVRSGRVSCTRTYLGDDKVTHRDFVESDSPAFIPDLGEVASPLIGGTSISLFLPIRTAVQQRLL